MKFRYIFLSVLLMAGLLSVRAQSFDEVIAEVLLYSPRLAADSLTSRADLLKFAAEGNLPDPEIEFDMLWGKAPDGTERRWGAGVSQSFDWPGVYAARSQALSAARSAEEYAAVARLRAMALEVRLALIDVVSANCRVALLREVSANVDSLLELTRRRYDRGDVTVLTLRRMEFERFSAAAALDEALGEQDRLRADIAAMAGGTLIDTDRLIEFPAPQLLPEERYLAAANPAIDALRERVHSDLLSAKAARLSRLPGFSVGYQHEFEEGIHFNGFKLGLTLPLLSTRHSATEARLRAEAGETELTSAGLTRAAQVRALHSDAVRMMRRLEALDELFATDNYLELLRASYSGGQITAHEYLGEINDYLTLRLDRVATAASLARVIAQLNGE
ncbi:MAG: TolC family protein [Muribaculaceae bacterium]|nr:TolC family protein [Muribaculaceae bacterium]